MFVQETDTFIFHRTLLNMREREAKVEDMVGLFS